MPQVVGDGFDEHGQEILTWVEGEVVHPEPFPDAEDSLFEIGRLLRQLHHATATFVLPPGRDVDAVEHAS